MAKKTGATMTAAKLQALEKRIAKQYANAAKEMKKTWDRYVQGYDEVVGGKLVHHNGMQERFQKEYQAYQDGKYTDEQFKKWWDTQIAKSNEYKAMVNLLAHKATQSNQVAAAYINDETPSIAALSANWNAFLISQNVPKSPFRIYNEQTIKTLLTKSENVTEFRTVKVNPIRDYHWNTTQIQNALTVAIMQGKSIEHLADAFMVVMQRNRKAAVRNARTAFTSAMNCGTIQSMVDAKKMGINIKKKWFSMEDASVRNSHVKLNGEIRDVDKPFSNGLMYPGDSKGAPREVYNCRCTMLDVLGDYEVDTDPDADFDAWLNSNQAQPSQNAATNATKQINVSTNATKQDIIDGTQKYADSMSNDDYNAFIDLVSNDERISNVYALYADEISKLENTGGKGVFHSHDNSIEYRYYDDKYIQSGLSKYTTLSHESGHFFDTKLTDGLTFNERDAINNSLKVGTVTPNAIIKVASSSDEFLAAARADKAALAANLKQTCANIRMDNTTNGVQDFLDGAFSKNADVRWVHGDKYYNRFWNNRVDNAWVDNRSKFKDALNDIGVSCKTYKDAKNEARIYEAANEAWANITAAYTVGGKQLEAVQTYMPNMCSVFEQIIGGVKWKKK